MLIKSLIDIQNMTNDISQLFNSANKSYLIQKGVEFVKTLSMTIKNLCCDTNCDMLYLK